MSNRQTRKLRKLRNRAKVIAAGRFRYGEPIHVPDGKWNKLIIELTDEYQPYLIARGDARYTYTSTTL